MDYTMVMDSYNNKIKVNIKEILNLVEKMEKEYFLIHNL